MAKCPDCDGESLWDVNIGNGKCSCCHGTGQEIDPLESLEQRALYRVRRQHRLSNVRR